MPSDVLITPASSKIDFTDGSNATKRLNISGTAFSFNSNLNVLSSTSLSSAFKAEGVNGTLFEVVDDLSSSLMSVNTIGGLPVFEVFANNSIIAGQYNANDFVLIGNKIGIGTASPTGKLTIFQGNNPGITLFSNNAAQYAYLQIGRTSSELEIGVVSGSNQFFTGTVTADAVIKQNSTGKLHLGYGSAAPSITIDSSNNVGVGTVSPTLTSGKGLHIYSSSGHTNLKLDNAGRIWELLATTGGYFSIYDSTSAVDRLIISSSGNVGIGNTGPNNKLHVAGSASIGSSYNVAAPTNGLVVQGNVGIGTTTVSSTLHLYSLTGPELRLSAGSTGSGGLRFLKGDSGESYINNQDSYAMRFQIAGSTKMSIIADGNVGIGTASPLTLLDVRSGSITSGTANSTSGSTIIAGYYTSGALTVLGTEQSSGGPVLGYAVTPSTSATGAFLSSTTIAIPRSAYTQDGGTHRWYIGASQTVAIGSAVTTSEVMRINSSGNLGVGITSPTQKLSVADTLSITNTAGIQYLLMGNQDSSGANNPAIIQSANGAFSFGGGTSWSGSGGTFTSTMFLSDAGNVGIGTVTPSAKLSTGATSGMKLLVYDNSSTGVYTGLGQDLAAGNSTDLFAHSVSNLGFITFGKIGTNGSTYTEWGRFNPSGNLGIGTTNPTNKLHVYSSDNELVFIRGTTAGAWINVQSSTSNLWSIGADGVNGFSVYNRNSNNYALIVRNDGNLGIGNITTASNKLHVNGSASIGSNYNTAAPTNGLIVEGSVAIGATTASDKLTVVNGNISLSDSYKLYNGSASDSVGLFFSAALQVNISGYNGIIFRSSTTNIAGQTERMRITNNGNVGIGITVPSATLHLNSTTSGATLLRADGTNGTLFSVVDDLSDSLMSVNNSAGLPVLEVFADDRVVAGQYGANDFVLVNNKLGLGTNNPQYELDIVGPGTNAAVNIITRIRSSASSDTFNTGSVIAFTNTTTNVNAYSYIGSRIDLGSAGDNAQALIFATNATNTLPTEKMRIKSDGNVGIGTVSPAYKLDVNGNGYFNSTLQVNSNITLSGGGDVIINDSDGTGTFNSFMDSGVGYIRIDDGGSANGTLNINSGTLFVGPSSGNVGVGTVSPAAKLHVNGSMTFGYGSDATFFTGTEFDSSKYLILQNNTNSYGRVGLTINAKTFNGANTPSTNDGWALDPRSGIRFRAYLSGDSDYVTKFAIQHLLANATNAVGDLGIFARGFSTTLPAFVLTGGGSIGIGTTTPVVLLQIGTGTPTAATGGIQFGGDTGTRLYRSASGIITCSGTIAATFSGALTGNVTGNVSGTAGGETLGTVTGRGSSTTTQISVGTTSSGSMYTGIKSGAGYSDTVSGATFKSITDHPTGGSFAFAAYYNGAPGTGTNSFYVAANGGAYFAQGVGIGVTSPLQALHINGNIILDGTTNGYTQSTTRGIGYGSNNGAVSVDGFSGMDIQSVNAPAPNNGNYSQNLRFWTHHYGTGTGATPRMFLQYNGNLGIGTLSPTAKLNILSTSSLSSVLKTEGVNGTLFEVTDDLSNSLMSVNTIGGLPVFEVFANNSIVAGQYGQNNFVISGNKVGIGTNNPSKLLHVAGDMVVATTSKSGTIFFGTDGGTETYIRRDNNYDLIVAQNDSSGNGLYLAGAGSVYVSIDSNNNGTTDAFIVQNNSIKSGTELFRIQENGNVGIGTVSPGYILDVRGDVRIGNGSSSEQDIRFVSLNGDWQVGTNNGGNGTNNNQFYFYDSAYRLTIQSGTGNIGIGTASPGASLEIYATPATSTTLRQMLIINTDFGSASGTGFGGSIVFRGRTAGNLLRDNAQITAYNEDIGDNGYALGFFTRPNDTLGMVQRITIARGGNVGIGTVSPSQILDVRGNIKLGADNSGNYIYYVTDIERTIIRTARSDVSQVGLFRSDGWGNFTVDKSIGIGYSLGSNFASSTIGNGNLYVAGNVGIGTTAPAALLQIGTGTPTAVTGGIQFGGDTSARLYRSSSGVVSVSNSFAAASGYVYASNYLQTGNNLIYPASFSATQRLEVGNTAQNAWITGISIAPGGNVVVAGTLTESSSIRYKENIQTVSAPILPKLNEIRPVTYNKKDNPNNIEYGIIAEELNDLFPELVNKNNNGEVESVNYSRLTVLLIKAVKELKQEIEILKNK